MGILVHRLVVGPIEENCYILEDKDTKEGIVVDPGDEGERIIAYIKEKGIKVRLLINTHGHWDHIGAVDALREAFGVKLAIHGEDAPMLSSGRENLSVYMRTAEVQRPAEILLKHDEEIVFGNSSCRVIHTPGHSKGGICLFGDDVLISGDTLFADDIGRADLPGGDLKTLLNSVNEVLAIVPDSARVYPGHGPASDMESERRYNPYMQK